MALCLVADDAVLIGRWASILSEFRPIVEKDIFSAFEKDSILFISDKALLKISDDQLKTVFTVPCMILAVSPHFLDAQRYLHLGAMDYGNAMMHETHLRSAYQALLDGKVWLHPDFISMLMFQVRQHTLQDKNVEKRLEMLSSREKEVAIMLGDGATHQQIAETLNITVRTVKAHATSIYHKLDLNDRLALSLYLHN